MTTRDEAPTNAYDVGVATLPIRVFRVDTPDGPMDYVSCLSENLVFAHGLPEEAIIGVVRRALEPGEPVTPHVFAKNPGFVEFMHGVVERRAPQVPGINSQARRQRDGWIYVIDQRTPSPAGSVPPEDIIGAFEVREGSVVAGTYRPCPGHVILSGRGFFQLGPELQSYLLEELTLRLQQSRPT